MSASSSSGPPPPGPPQQDQAPLPLIRCPRCNLGVIQWGVSSTSKNPGRHFYKCSLHQYGRCSFWRWENQYIDYLRARWGHVFAMAPAAAPHIAPAGAPPMNDELRALLLQNQQDLKNIFMLGIAILFAVVLMVTFKI